MAVKFVPAEEVPARVVSATARERLAEYQAAEKARRAAEAAPLVAGLIEGQALTDGTTYEDAPAADKVAQQTKRLVEPSLKELNKRPSVRVTPKGKGFQWHVLAVDNGPAAEDNGQAAS